MSIYGSSTFNLSSLFSGINRLNQNKADITQSLERLSTGKRINRATDDPSGLVAATKLDASILSIQRRLTSFQRESTSLGAQEGGLSVISDLLIELDALTVTNASTGSTTQEERNANTDQAQSILTTINQISSTTTFQGVNILTGFNTSNLASISRITTDPETGESATTQVTLADLPDLLESNPELAQDLAQQAAQKITSRRSAIGNRINAIESESATLQSELTNTAQALSQIQDTDYAVESAKLVRAQILEQATVKAILTQRQQVESMLDLLTNTISTPPSPPLRQ